MGISPLFIEGIDIQGIVAGIAVSLGSAGVAWLARKKYYERSERFQKLERTYRAMFGNDDIETMEGVVELIEAHEEDIDELFDKVENMDERWQDLEERVEKLKCKVDERKNGGS